MNILGHQFPLIDRRELGAKDDVLSRRSLQQRPRKENLMHANTPQIQALINAMNKAFSDALENQRRLEATIEEMGCAARKLIYEVAVWHNRLDEVVSLLPDQPLQAVSPGVTIGESREFEIEGRNLCFGRSHSFAFLRVASAPNYAFLISENATFNEWTLSEGVHFRADLLNGMNAYPLLKHIQYCFPNVPVFSLFWGMPACELCSLGLNHHEDCDKYRLQCIEQAARKHGITRLITGDFSKGAWNASPDHVAFRSLKTVLNPEKRGYDDNPAYGVVNEDVHCPRGIRDLVKHFFSTSGLESRQSQLVYGNDEQRQTETDENE